jgi:hypothetical protein
MVTLESAEVPISDATLVALVQIVASRNILRSAILAHILLNALLPMSAYSDKVCSLRFSFELLLRSAL